MEGTRDRARVEVGGRLHFGFQNLSLAHDRLYGGIGVALAGPAAVVEAEPATGVEAPEAVLEAAETAVDLFDLEGATVRLVESLPTHVGLGSGTQHALATCVAVGAAHGIDPRPREWAPELGRGGRSGVGVARFEAGGFVLDAGHPTRQFTTEPPGDGEWSVPPVTARHALPEGWRAVLVEPDVDRGHSGAAEDAAMREVIEEADPALSDRIAATVSRGLLPAAAAGDLQAFGGAVAEVSRQNGAWYSDEQGGVFRPPVGTIVDTLEAAPSVEGAGQSSWGPTAFGITDADRADAAREAGRRALDRAGVGGAVRVVGFDDEGAEVDSL